MEALLVEDTARRVMTDLWDRRDERLLRLLSMWEPYQIRFRLEKLLRRPIELSEILEGPDPDGLLDIFKRIQSDKWDDFQAGAGDENGSLWRIERLAERCEKELKKKAKSDKDFVNQEKAERLLGELLDPLRRYVESASPGSVDAKVFDDFQAKAAEIRPPLWRPTTKQILDGLREELIPWQESLDRDMRALDFVLDFVGVAQEARDVIDRIKRDRALLSHDDLLLKARVLCTSQPATMRGAIQHILVDEFQDTDPIQWETILTLAKDRRGLPRNLFLVGDVKQAIYGFRGADHTITATARQALMEAEGGADTTRTLHENFRSLRAPLDFTNELFDRLFGDAAADYPYGVPPQPLTSFRSSQDDNSPATTSFLVTHAEEEADPWEMEAQAAARFLRRVMDRGEPDYEKITDLMREGKPAVGILFRAYAPMSHYMGELTREGVPFSVYHGRTFYETSEVVSLTNMLAWLADPYDDTALVGVLRSPLFHWTDQDLLRLIRFSGRHNFPLLEKLEAVSQNEEASLSELAQQTLAALQLIRRHCDHLSMSETLRAAMDETLAAFTLAQGARGSQAEANIEKFLAVVREVEAVERSSPQSVLRAIKMKRDTGPGESEAESPSEQRAAVQLMTVHAAKGLEFPMVMIANLGRNVGGPPDLFPKRISLAGEEEWETMDRVTLCGIDFPDEKRGLAPYPTILKSVLKDHDERLRNAEEKRLLYVALTRAEDHTVMPVVVKKGKVIGRKGSHGWLMREARVRAL